MYSDPSNLLLFVRVIVPISLFCSELTLLGYFLSLVLDSGQADFFFFLCQLCSILLKILAQIYFLYFHQREFFTFPTLYYPQRDQFCYSAAVTSLFMQNVIQHSILTINKDQHLFRWRSNPTCVWSRGWNYRCASKAKGFENLPSESIKLAELNPFTCRTQTPLRQYMQESFLYFCNFLNCPQIVELSTNDLK